MIQKNDELEKAINAINQNVQPQKVFLFGSFSKGTSSKNSDLDLCILIEELKERKVELLRKIRYSLAQTVTMPVDLLLYSSDEFNERATVSSTLEYKILNEGNLVYES